MNFYNSTLEENPPPISPKRSCVVEEGLNNAQDDDAQIIKCEQINKASYERLLKEFKSHAKKWLDGKDLKKLFMMNENEYANRIISDFQNFVEENGYFTKQHTLESNKCLVVSWCDKYVSSENIKNKFLGDFEGEPPYKKAYWDSKIHGWCYDMDGATF